MLLGPVDVGPRGAVDDRVRTRPRDRRLHGALIGDVEPCARERERLVAGGRARGMDV